MPADEKRKFNEVDPRVNINELEQGILAFWEKEKIFEKSLEQNKDKPLFTFYDGPPYATGKPHYGHVLQSAIKDTVLRYKTMRGNYVPRRVGWDTHGLPVETLVEKELGFKTKKDIEELGIEEFNKRCRETVYRYIDEFTATLKRMGRWADYENAYSTLDLDYMESEWWAFKQLWEKNLIYKDFRSTPYCIRCATPLSNFETSMGYKNKTDKTVYVLFEVNNSPPSQGLRGTNKQLSLLVWTTTPWTLPANVAIAFNPAIEYVAVEQGDKEIILAKDRVADLFGSDATILRTITADELQNKRYEGLFPFSAEQKVDAEKLYTVVPGEFVTTEEGTGLVHIAPAFGTEDHALARQIGLPVVRTVAPNGVFYESVTTWGGKHIWKANPEIAQNLEERGLLFKQEDYTHSYPHCWRCDQPLIYYALDSWFVRVTDIKEKMLAENEKITWIPEHIKHGRFAKGVESAPDWAISRNRFWSVPIPIWRCAACEHQVCVGSVEELRKLSGTQEIKDLHRPYVDEITWDCTECDGTMKRIEEVLDVWFDSGAMPYSQWHYPFENKEFVESGFPADFIAESIEMTRAWFYVLHVLAVALKGSPAYKNVIGSGIIFGSDGNKLSKKLKNYPEIEPTLEQFGADTVRLFFLLSTLGEPYVFAEKELQQLFRNFTLTLWNTYSFFVRYANTSEWKVQSEKLEVEHILDKWILARLKQLQYTVTTEADSYRIDTAARAFIAFVDDLSNWYVRRSRERFQPKGEQDTNAFMTLHYVLVEFSKLLSPFMPFVTEDMYRNLTGNESVHLAELSDAPEVSEEDEKLLHMMQSAREIVSQGLAARAAAKIKIRQPLKSLAASGVKDLPTEVLEMIKEEVNVDEVTDAAEGIQLDTEITLDLKARGIAREIIRNGQALRRNAEYALNDKIILALSTEDSELKTIIENQQKEIMQALQATELLESGDVDAEKEFSVDGKKVTIGVKKNS